MPGYEYSERQLNSWSPAAVAAALKERCNHLQDQVNYWKHRAESSEARMIAHDCGEES